MRKRWIQCMVPLGLAVGVLSGCEYSDLMRVGLDEATPKVVAPVLCDTLTVEEMASRRGESTSLRYEGSDQLAYVYHADTMRLGQKQMALQWNHTPSTAKREVEITLPTTTGFTQPVWLTFKLFVHADLREAILNSQAFDVVMQVLEAPEGFAEAKAKLKLATLPELTQDFTLRLDQPTRVPVGSVVNGKKLNLFDADSRQRDQLQVTLVDWQLPSSLSGKLKLSIQVETRGVSVQKAWGLTNLGYSASQQSQVMVKADAFATTVLADQSLPGVELGVTIRKAPGMNLEFAVEGLRGYNPKSPTFPSQGIQIINTEDPLSPGTLNVRGSSSPQDWNRIAPEQEVAEFVLNSSNSTIEEPFSKGANRLSFGRIELQEPRNSEDQELLVGPRVLDLVKWVKIPLDGWARSNLMRSELVVSGGFFESTSNALKGSDADGIKLEDIFLCFHTTNALPLDVYARFTFMDKNMQPLLVLRFDGEGVPVREELGLFSKSAALEGRFAGAPAETYREVKISREEYDKLANSAVKMVTEYLFTSSGVDSETRVALRKQDYVRVNIALRLAGRVTVMQGK